MDETFAEYSFRMACEARLKKEAIAKEAAERKRQKKAKSKEDRRLDRERRRQLPSHVLELIADDKEQALKIIEAKSKKLMQIAIRKDLGLCVSCGDDRDITVGKIYCRQWGF